MKDKHETGVTHHVFVSIPTKDLNWTPTLMLTRDQIPKLSGLMHVGKNSNRFEQRN